MRRAADRARRRRALTILSSATAVPSITLRVMRHYGDHPVTLTDRSLAVVSISERAKNICLTPQTEWPVIAAEASSPGTLVAGYVAPLAAIGAAAGFIGGSLVGRSLPYLGTYRVPIFSGLVVAA